MPGNARECPGMPGNARECPGMPGNARECPGMPGNAREHSLNARECPGVWKECPGEITLIITLVTNKIAYFMKD